MWTVGNTEQLVVESIVVSASTFVQKNVESVFEDTSLGEFNFGMFTIGGVNNGCTTYFGYLVVWYG